VYKNRSENALFANLLTTTSFEVIIGEIITKDIIIGKKTKNGIDKNISIFLL
jgi:hypothetical protein